jgi:hypothetical protein
MDHSAQHSQELQSNPAERPEWSMHLVMDVALGASVESILESHQLAHHHFEQIVQIPTFVLQVEELRAKLAREGATFKLKAQLQADFYLGEVHKKIMDPATDQRVFTRLVENVVRWGGLDAPATVGGPSGGGFQININFSGAAPANGRQGITIDGD